MTHRGWSASGIAAVLRAAAVAIGRSVQDPAVAADFVTVEGTNLIRRGRTYHFVGANLWFGCNLAALAEAGDRDRLRRELDLHSCSPSAATTASDRFFGVVLEPLHANAAADASTLVVLERSAGLMREVGRR